MEQPHYIVTSDKITLLPLIGIFIADGDVLYVKSKNKFDQSDYHVPLFYLPTFIYGSDQIRLLGNEIPIPELGSTPLEGWYLKNQFNYLINENISVSSQIGYTNNYGYIANLKNTFSPTIHSTITTDFQLNENVTPQGKLSYSFSFFQPDIPTSFLINDLFSALPPLIELPSTKGTIQVAQNMPINNFWVSQSPLVSIEINELQTPLLGIVVDGMLQFGNIKESDPNHSFNDLNVAELSPSTPDAPYTFSASQTLVKVNPSTKFSISSVTLTSNLDYVGSLYNNSQLWQRLFLNLTLDVPLPLISPSLTYSQKLVNQGKSLLLYDSEGLQQNSEVSLFLASTLGPHELSLNTVYTLEKKEFREILFSLGSLIHCYKLTLSLEMLAPEFQISIRLL